MLVVIFTIITIPVIFTRIGLKLQTYMVLLQGTRTKERLEGTHPQPLLSTRFRERQRTARRRPPLHASAVRCVQPEIEEQGEPDEVQQLQCCPVSALPPCAVVRVTIRRATSSSPSLLVAAFLCFSFVRMFIKTFFI